MWILKKKPKQKTNQTKQWQPKNPKENEIKAGIKAARYRNTWSDNCILQTTVKANNAF